MATAKLNGKINAAVLARARMSLKGDYGGRYFQMSKSDRTRLSPGEQVLHWLCRDFDTTEKWKREAREVFLKAMGNSTLARYYLADDIRKTVIGTAECPPGSDAPEDTDGFGLRSAASPRVNSPYVNWIWVADYFLLSAANSWDDFDEENQFRKELHRRAVDGWESRNKVSAVRKYLTGHPSADDDEVKAELKNAGFEIASVQISLARKSTYDTCPGLATELEPDPPPFLVAYQALYF